ncbi:MAG: RNA degradosome polyphosphate kinase, partial [Clostridiales bacterium]|nr:RNA degradosome polyphosphate kinase [Clostridiales bacterium]
MAIDIAGGAVNPEHYINRELSWLEFNRRVLDEATNPQNPPFEQMKFLSIAATNLDEFFMVRVASLWDQADAGYDLPDAAGLKPSQQLAAAHERAGSLMRRMYEILRRDLLPELARHGIRFADGRGLTDEQQKWLSAFFESDVYPVLTPMAVDATRPFPLILSRSLNLGLLVADQPGGEPMFATVQVPSGLPRAVRLPGDGVVLMPMEQVISRFIERLFLGRHVLCCHPYRITRNADLSIDERDAEDLLKVVEESLRKRRWGSAVRLEIDHRADERMTGVLA